MPSPSTPDQPAPSERIWSLNPALRMHPFDRRGASTEWVLELDDRDGRTQRLLVTRPVVDVLQRFATGVRPRDVFQALSGEGWSRARLDTLWHTLTGECVTRKILVASDDSETHAPKQAFRPTYMLAMVRLLPASVVNPIARRLTFLYSPLGLKAALAATAAGLTSLITTLVVSPPASGVTAGSILGAVMLSLLVVLMHELGHATAAYRFGARKVSIGVGWYAVIPVGYADLSETWKFTRGQRMLVDAAGVTMQGWAVFVLMLLHLLHPSPTLLVAAIAASVSILWNLNPLLRMDGYWLLSDWLGSSQLRTDALAALKSTTRTLLGCPTPHSRANARVSPRLAGLLAFYAIASSAFFVAVIAFAAIHFQHGLFVDLPERSRHVLTSDWRSLGLAQGAVVIGALAWKIVFVCLIGRLLLQAARSFVPALARRRSADSGKAG